MRTSSFTDAKNFGFFEIYYVSTRTREGLSQRGHFVFAILCGRLLWTVPYFG